MNRNQRIGAFGILLLALLLGLGGGKTSAQAEPLLEQPDVLIDVGHGGIDGGTSQGKLLEKDINLAIARQLYDKLQKDGLHVAMDRTGDYALSEDNRGKGSRHRRDLAQRTAIANRLSPQMVVSLHVNWSKAKSKSGPLILYQNNSLSILLATSVQKSLNRLYSTHVHPENGKSFYLLNHCKSPTVIVEMGFLSNDNDRKRMTSRSGQAKIAEAIASAIREYLLMASRHSSGAHSGSPAS